MRPRGQCPARMRAAAVVTLLALSTLCAAAPRCFDYEQLRDKLAFHIPFDDDFRDASGNGLHGTAPNAPSFARPGRVGGGTGVFDAARRQYVSLGRPPVLNLDTNVDFSVSFWLRPTGMPFSEGKNSYNDPAIMGNQDWNSSRNRGFIFAVQQNGIFIFALGDGTSRVKSSTHDGFMKNGEWAHVLLSCNRSSSAVVYVNGEMLFRHDSRTFDGVGAFGHNLTSGYDTVIGSDGPAGYVYPSWWSGNIDDVAMWTRALTPDDAAAVYQRGNEGLDMHSGLPASCEDTVAVCGVPEEWPRSFRISCAPGCAPLPLSASVRNPVEFDIGTSVCRAAVALGLASPSPNGPNATVTVSLWANATSFSLMSVCGDGVRAGAEECDDGNLDGGDGCKGCTVEAGYTCAEQAHGLPDGATVAGRSVCKTTCGDGIVAGGEKCERARSGPACTDACDVSAGYYCGQPTLRPMMMSLHGGANVVCHAISCGDAVRSTGEECDDGNLVDGDGCSSACKVEADWACDGRQGGRGDVCSGPLWVSPSGHDEGNCTRDAPCATIHAAVQRAAAAASSAYVLVESGTYNFTRPITPWLAPGRSVLLRAPSKGAVIDCQGSGTAMVVSGSNLRMEGFWVRNCEASDMSVAAVTVVNGNATFVDCGFSENRLSRNTTSSPRVRAPAVVVRKDPKAPYATASFTRCHFWNNTAVFARTAFVVFEVLEAVQSASVAAGAVACNGIDSVDVDSCVFNSNTAVSTSTAGAVYVGAESGHRAPRLSVVGCIFEDNAATGEREASGAVLVSASSQVTYLADASVSVTNSTFTRCAGNISSASTSEFARGHVEGALGVFLWAAECPRAHVTVSGCAFEDNRAGMVGYVYAAASGAVAALHYCFGMTSEASVDVASSIFRRNAATARSVQLSAVGGSVAVVYYRGDTVGNAVAVRACAFESDVAQMMTGAQVGVGGSIAVATVMSPHLYGTDAMTVVGNSLLFANNTHFRSRASAFGNSGVVAGGAVCVFQYTQNGGYVHVGNNVTMTGCLVRNATVDVMALLHSVGAPGYVAFYGGGTHDNAHVISDTAIEGSKAYLQTTGTNCLGTGAVAILFTSTDLNSKVALIDATMDGCSAEVLTGSAAGAAGVMYDGDAHGGSFAVRRCTLQNSVCGTGSGAIEVMARTGVGMTVDLSDSTFVANQGKKGSGVMRAVSSSAVVRVSDCTFSRNFGSDCGALSLTVDDTSCADVARSQFVGNLGSVAGGALSLNGPVATNVSDVFFLTNEASVGGAVFLGRLADFRATRCAFAGNTASSGSEVYSGGTSVILDRCTVSVSRAVPSISFLGDASLVSRQWSPIVCPRGHVFEYTTGSALQLSCTKCAAGSYLLVNGSDVNMASCTPCPMGAVCEGGDHIRAIGGHWGSLRTPAAPFAVCPPGYCCDSTEGCEAQMCAANRMGTMCSTCVPGTSATLFRRACVDNSQCHDGSWFVPLIVAALVVLFALFVRFRVGRSGALRIVAGFAYTAFVVVAIRGGGGAQSMLVINGLATLQFAHVPDLSSDVCLFPGMTSLGVVFFEFFPPLVFGAIATVYLACWRFGAACFPLLRKWVAPVADCPASVFYGAFVLFFMPLFATTLRLLDCVDIDGESRLHEMASEKCFDNGWQAAAFAALPFFAFVLCILAACVRLFAAHAVHPTGRRPCACYDVRRRSRVSETQEVVASAGLNGLEPPEKESVAWWRVAGAAIGAAAAAPYKAELRYWDVAAMGFRVVLTLCAVLIDEGGVREFVLCFLLWIAFLVHWHVCPWRREIDADMEAVSLFVLVFISTLQLREATVYSLGLSTAEMSPSMQAVFDALNVVCLSFVLVFVGVSILRSAAKARSLRGLAKFVEWASSTATGWGHTPAPPRVEQPRRRKLSRVERERIEDANAKAEQYYGDVKLPESDATESSSLTPSTQEAPLPCTPVTSSPAMSQSTASSSALVMAPTGTAAAGHFTAVVHVDVPVGAGVGLCAGVAADAAAAVAMVDRPAAPDANKHRPAQRKVSFGHGSEEERTVIDLAAQRQHRPALRTASGFAPGGMVRKSSLKRSGHQPLVATQSDTAALQRMRERHTASSNLETLQRMRARHTAGFAAGKRGGAMQAPHGAEGGASNSMSTLQRMRERQTAPSRFLQRQGVSVEEQSPPPGPLRRASSYSSALSVSGSEGTLEATTAIELVEISHSMDGAGESLT